MPNPESIPRESAPAEIQTRRSEILQEILQLFAVDLAGPSLPTPFLGRWL